MNLPPFETILVLVIVGFLMIAAEVFVPGMILGILGGCCLIGAILLSYIEYGAVTGTLMLAGIGTFCLIGFFVWIFTFPKTFIGRRVTNTGKLENDAFPLAALEGKEGKASTDLRPAGTALIENRRIDVVSDESFIESGTPVRVVRVEGSTVTVRKGFSPRSEKR